MVAFGVKLLIEITFNVLIYINAQSHSTNDVETCVVDSCHQNNKILYFNIHVFIVTFRRSLRSNRRARFVETVRPRPGISDLSHVSNFHENQCSRSLRNAYTKRECHDIHSLTIQLILIHSAHWACNYLHTPTNAHKKFYVNLNPPICVGHKSPLAGRRKYRGIHNINTPISQVQC